MSRPPPLARLPSSTRLAVNVRAIASQAKTTSEHSHGLQGILGTPMSGRGGSVATTVTDAICASESLSRALSLLLCAVESGEVRLFLRKSRVGSGRLVYTRSEHAVVGILVYRDCMGRS